MKSLLTLFILAVGFQLSAQTQTYYVPPSDIDAAYIVDQDSHAIILNPLVEINRIFLWIGGTGSNPTQYPALMDDAADLGYHVINLSYPNEVTANSLNADPDLYVFDKFRQEICFGTPGSDAVDVDTLNSIYTRFVKLITYLEANSPTENWSQFFLAPGVIDWSKVATGGHSQGAGHAAYLAKVFPVNRALMFSGPNDYSTFYSAGGNWLSSNSVSEIERYYAYLSLYDEFVDFSKQFADIEALGMLNNDDTTLVDVNSSPYGFSKCLYTIQQPGIVLIYHNVPVKNSFINHDVWEYMLTDPITIGIAEGEIDQLTLFPNPSSNTLNIGGIGATQMVDIELRNSSGRLILNYRNAIDHSIDISHLATGVYFIAIKFDNKVVNKIFIKE
ncbi:MAG: T9SS type A sorting domain-containing protein [Crocinitomicaceae bacterium]|nr:T9SS type A sorting domain-containing protein [Crocinitomicaceae bacterium]